MLVKYVLFADVLAGFAWSGMMRAHDMDITTSKKRLPVLACALFFFLNGYGVALAHAVVVESNPREGEVLKQAPDRILLRFNVKIEKTLTRISLTKDGKQAINLPLNDFTRGAPERLQIRLPHLENGDYFLRYSVLAADGHVTQGVLRFSVVK